MIPVFSDRRTDWPSHPHATRDSLHEHDMWVAEGLTHRYPTKVLAELLPTCPQYCGHCTRMDLVGNSTPVIDKLKFAPSPRRPARRDARLPAAHARGCATSWSPAATSPTCRGRGSRRSSTALLEIDNIRDIRLATKALMGLPQHWLQTRSSGGHGPARPRTARARGVSIAIHTHVNHAQSVTPLVAEATRAMLDTGIRDVRNQGVLLRGVNDSPHALLDLCFALLDGAQIMPYYFYMCDMIPCSRALAALARRGASSCSTRSWATCPASPPRGSSATCRSSASAGCTRSPGTTPSAASRTGRRTTAPRSRPTTPRRSAATYDYYDPIHTLPEAGQAWWRTQRSQPRASSAAVVSLANATG